MKKIHSVIAAILLSSIFVSSQVLIDVQSDKNGTVISPVLYGIFFEEINHAGDGGLYAELIRNRSFEDSDDEALGWRII